MTDAVTPDVRTPRLRPPDIRIREARPRRSRMTRRDVRWLILASLLFHLLAVALFLLLTRHMAPVVPKEPPSFGMVFEPSKEMIRGGKSPSKFTSTPRGETAPEMRPTPPPAAPPPSAAARQAPEVNPFPPEFMQPQEPPPPPPQANAEPLPSAPPHPPRRRARPAPSSNPFANLVTPNLTAPPARPQRSAGLRNSRSLDLQEGPVIAGGQLMDAVTHVVGPGGPEDYMAMLSEYIETHKYYPESAAANGEQGESVVRVTIERDGRVREVSLVQSAYSPALDAAWEAVFRGQKLPAFTDDMKEQELTLTLSLDYILTYGRR